MIEGIVRLVDQMGRIHDGGTVSFAVTSRDTGVEALMKVLEAGNDRLDEEKAARREHLRRLGRGDGFSHPDRSERPG